MQMRAGNLREDFTGVEGKFIWKFSQWPAKPFFSVSLLALISCCCLVCAAGEVLLTHFRKYLMCRWGSLLRGRCSRSPRIVLTLQLFCHYLKILYFALNCPFYLSSLLAQV